MQPLEILLAIAVCTESLILLGMFFVSCFRERFMNRQFKEFRESQKRYLTDAQEMIRDVTQTLADVTAALSATVKAVEGNEKVTKEVKSELLNNFNQTETRLVAMLQRIEQQTINISNANIAGHSRNKLG